MLPDDKKADSKQAKVTTPGTGLTSAMLVWLSFTLSLSASLTAQGQVTFTQQTAPAATAQLSRDQHWRHSFPENECSADFWDPYAARAAAITQSPARVQQNLRDLIDPADTVQELPGEVVEPAETVQQLDRELVQPAGRVQQLDHEVIRAEEPLGDQHPTKAWADEPGDHPD